MSGDHTDKRIGPADAPEEQGRHYGCNLPQDGTLTGDGWEARGTADERRLREIVDMYEELGFEVRLEPIDTDVMCSACDGCKGAFTQFSAVYVRKK